MNRKKIAKCNKVVPTTKREREGKKWAKCLNCTQWLLSEALCTNTCSRVVFFASHAHKKCALLAARAHSASLASIWAFNFSYMRSVYLIRLVSFCSLVANDEVIIIKAKEVDRAGGACHLIPLLFFYSFLLCTLFINAHFSVSAKAKHSTMNYWKFATLIFLRA